MAKLYAEISKAEKQDDGTITVSGYASSGAVDSDGEIITAEAMKAAIPEYMKFGAVREMHGKSAAGTAVEIKVEDDGRTFFKAHIVDPVAVKKVETGVYKGFSIGGSVKARNELNKAEITAINLTEISLVDRPANPDAVFTCFKIDKGDDEKPEENGEADKDEAKKKPSESDHEDGKKSSDDDTGKNGKKDDDETEKVAFSAAELDVLRKFLKQAEAQNEPKAESVQKSMYSVKSLASVLQEVQWFVNSAKYEELPDDVTAEAKQAAQTLANALVSLVGHEAGKVGDETAEKSDTPDDLQKAFNAKVDDLTKVQKELADTKAELEALKKQAAPPKGGVKHVIAKSEDNGGNEDLLQGFTPIVKGDGSLDEAATLVKAAQSGRL
ncbi:HK97 family phage prohead protease [Bergeriella denitrificans]|uniref:Alanyl-tRNA synthetase Alanine-tRNA ligase AlaRS n=1 Tax=Bergeriella denitrificans TaxID=494 RepID=A0A378ULK4_BERDE|nr:HK97 family phage prohead protease [Bergeriella denitrificans]STZ77352.1 Alanyl-tRNA synthetase Alanine-tRNA ligase; AlaRS [Bergeriella denitrificans]